jgi:hypothetical protein
MDPLRELLHYRACWTIVFQMRKLQIRTILLKKIVRLRTGSLTMYDI